MRTIFQKLFERVMNLSPRRLAVVTTVAAAVAAVIVMVLFPILSVGTQSYKDIVVGEITYADAYKHGDILLSFLAVGCFFLIWFVLVLLPVNRPSDMPVLFAKDWEGNQILSWGLCFFGAGLLLFRNGFPRFECFILLVLLGVYAAARFTVKPDGQGMCEEGEKEGCQAISSTENIVIIWAVSVWGIFFSSIGLLALIRFFTPKLFAGREDAVSSMPLYAALIGAFGLLLMIRSSAVLRSKIAIWSQVLMPLLLITFFSRVMIQNGIVTDNLLPLHSKIIGLVIAIGGVSLNVRGMLRCTSESDRNNYLLVPSIVAAASFMAYVTPTIKQIDFFHTGELLLAWQQIFEYGQMPYTGFAWARGWSDAFPGLLAKLFFDGTFSTFDMGFNATGMLISGAAAFLLCRAVGPLWGLLLSMLGAQSGIFKWWLYLPILLILASPFLLKRPLRWLSAWLVLSVVHCLFQATSGIALTFGTLPVAIWMLYLSWKNNELIHVWRMRKMTFLLSTLALVVFCCAAAPLLIGFVSYVHDQGVVNEIANGTILGRPTRIPEWFRWKSKLVWELFRVGGWMLGIVVVWHFLVRELSEYRRVKTAVPGAAIVVGIAVVCSMIAFIPYGMGRIDSGVLSRTGALSMLIFAILLPLIFRMSKQNSGKPAAILCSFLLGISLVPFHIDPPAIAKRALDPTEVSSDMVWFNGAANGLPKVGSTFIQGAQLEMITGFKEFADTILKPGETFFDLTNFLAYYYFLDKKVSSVYAGYYIVTSEQLQNKVIAELEKSPPPFVLAAPAREFGSGPASLRSYRVYRWFIQKGYVPILYRGAGYLVSSDRCRLLQIPVQSESIMTEDLANMFAHDSLGLLPVAWGRSLEGLSDRFDKVKVATQKLTTSVGSIFEPASGRQLLINRISCSIEGGVNGGLADFLVLRINAGSREEPLTVKLHWASPGRSDNELEFLAVPGVPLLVPAGSHPAWLRTTRIDQLNIDIAGAPATVDGIEFLHLKR